MMNIVYRWSVVLQACLVVALAPAAASASSFKAHTPPGRFQRLPAREIALRFGRADPPGKRPDRAAIVTLAVARALLAQSPGDIGLFAASGAYCLKTSAGVRPQGSARILTRCGNDVLIATALHVAASTHVQGKNPTGLTVLLQDAAAQRGRVEHEQIEQHHVAILLPRRDLSAWKLYQLPVQGIAAFDVRYDYLLVRSRLRDSFLARLDIGDTLADWPSAVATALTPSMRLRSLVFPSIASPAPRDGTYYVSETQLCGTSRATDPIAAAQAAVGETHGGMSGIYRLVPILSALRDPTPDTDVRLLHTRQGDEICQLPIVRTYPYGSLRATWSRVSGAVYEDASSGRLVVLHQGTSPSRQADGTVRDIPDGTSMVTLQTDVREQLRLGIAHAQETGDRVSAELLRKFATE